MPGDGQGIGERLFRLHVSRDRWCLPGAIRRRLL